VPGNPLAHFVRELVREQLDLSEIFAAYDEERGAPPFHPTRMTALLLYAYSQGVYSSRRISRGCEERVDFMAVTAMQKPDFRTVNEFRRHHLGALEGLFMAHDVKAEQNDAPQLPPMLAQIRANTGRQAKELSADNGYFS